MKSWRSTSSEAQCPSGSPEMLRHWAWLLVAVVLGCRDEPTSKQFTPPRAADENSPVAVSAKPAPPSAANEIQNSPLTISAERTPSLGVGGWRLKIDSAGKGELITEHFNESTRTPVKLTETQLK